MNGESIPYGGGYNTAGVVSVFYAYRSDILSFPTLAEPLTATTLESLVEITTPIVMKTGKRIWDLYGTLGEGKLDCNSVGPRDGKSYENMVEFSHPGNSPKFLGFLANAGNETFVLFCKEKNGRVRIVGSLEDPAYFEDGKSTSGAKPSDGRVTKVSFKDSKNTPAPIYTPALTSLLVPAV